MPISAAYFSENEIVKGVSHTSTRIENITYTSSISDRSPDRMISLLSEIGMTEPQPPQPQQVRIWDNLFVNFKSAARHVYQDHAQQLKEIYQRQTPSKNNNDNDNNDIAECTASPAIPPLPQNEVVVITGPPGVGKTSLALTLEEITKQDGGFFCRGKFNQSSASGYYHHQDVVDLMMNSNNNNNYTTNHNNSEHDSYQPFVIAITDLIQQILQDKNNSGRRSAYAASLQSTLEDALDSTELQALEESIPSLVHIIRPNNNNDSNFLNGSSTSSSGLEERWLSLKGPDAEKRYMHLFAKLVQAISSSLTNCSIVILIDDLQWANHNALQLLKLLVTTTPTTTSSSTSSSSSITSSSTRKNGLMLIGTARLDEIPSDDPLALVCMSHDDNGGKPPSNPLSTLLSDLKQAGVTVTDLPLDNLTKPETQALISHVLQLPKTETTALANIIYFQTSGNLFFILQLLCVLCGDGHLYMEPGMAFSSRWRWKEEEILQSYRQPQTVQDLLVKKILQLPDLEQRLLGVAACLGGTTMYQCLLEENPALSSSSEAVRAALVTLQQQGLVTFDWEKGSGSFLHDHIQVAAYSLTPKCNRPAVHLDLGRRLWKQLAPSDLETHLFTVVTQITRGLHLLDDRIEKEDLAALMHRAGEKAVLMSSFTAAASYFDVGIKLLGRRRWKSQYNLCLALSNAAAEVEYYNGNLVRVDTLLADIFDHAKSLDHKLRAHLTQIYSLGSRDDMKQALDKGLEVLKSLGERSFPRRPGKIHAVMALRRCRCLLSRRLKDDDAVMNLPLMTDSRQLVIMRLLNTIYGYAFSCNETLVTLITARMIENTVRHGISGLSCVGFALLGFCMGHRGYAQQAYRFGRLGLKIMERFQAKEWQCRVAMVVYGGVYSAHHPLKELIKPLQSSHRVGLVAGDINASLVCASFQCRVCFYSSEPLPIVVKRLEEYQRLCGFYGQMSVSMMFSHQIQLCFNFMGRAADPLILTGEAMDEKVTLERVQGKHPVAFTWILIVKHFLAVYFHDLEGAKSIAASLSKMRIGAILPFVLHTHLFLEGLTAAALSRNAQDQVKRAQKILVKLKALKHGNYENKIHLVEAELAASSDNRDDALSNYQHSIEAARRQGYLHEQALACEKAGYALLKWGDKAKSRDYLVAASALYGQWGALAKVKQVEKCLCGV